MSAVGCTEMIPKEFIQHHFLIHRALLQANMILWTVYLKLSSLGTFIYVVRKRDTKGTADWDTWNNLLQDRIMRIWASGAEQEGLDNLFGKTFGFIGISTYANLEPKRFKSFYLYMNRGFLCILFFLVLWSDLTFASWLHRLPSCHPQLEHLPPSQLPCHLRLRHRSSYSISWLSWLGVPMSPRGLRPWLSW